MSNFEKISKFTSKKDVAREYENYLCQKAEKEICRGVNKAYVAVIGQDDFTILVTYDDHFEKNALNRGFSLADDVVMKLIEYLETNITLAEDILNTEDIAYEKGKSHGVAAIHFQKEDWFLYLCVKDGIIHISTFISNKTYYINPDSELIVAVDYSGKKLFYGIDKNNRFCKSESRKYKGGNGH